MSKARDDTTGLVTEKPEQVKINSHTAQIVFLCKFYGDVLLEYGRNETQYSFSLVYSHLKIKIIVFFVTLE